MNFNPWQDYLNLKEVFCKDWNKNNDRSFPKIEPYHFVQQNESFTEDSIYFLNLKKELLKAVRNLTRSTEQKITETNEEVPKTKESNIKEKQATKIVESNKEEKNQNVTLPCSFCRKNGEQRMFYLSHSLKNSKGLVMCPILQKYVCPKCQATGPNAHTLLYCPQNNEYHSTSLTHLTPRMSSGRKRHNFKCI